MVLTIEQILFMERSVFGPQTADIWVVKSMSTIGTTRTETDAAHSKFGRCVSHLKRPNRHQSASGDNNNNGKMQKSRRPWNSEATLLKIQSAVSQRAQDLLQGAFDTKESLNFLSLSEKTADLGPISGYQCSFSTEEGLHPCDLSIEF
jgi:hypothetical protein